MKKFFLIIITMALILPFPVKGETTTVAIPAEETVGFLQGTEAGNRPSFDVAFSTELIPGQASIISATLSYTQTGISGGLLRIIDKYSADIVDSLSMADESTHEVTSILLYARKWFSMPSRNMGLLFQSSALLPGDSVTLSEIQLIVEYTFPDLTPPVVNGEIKMNVSSSMAEIEIFTSEPSFVDLEYGRTSEYGSKYETDNVVAGTGHLIGLVGLSSGSTYHYRSIIKDEAGNTTTTQDYSFETLTDFEPTGTRRVDQSLKAPQEFVVETVYSSGRPSASLSWNPSNEDGIRGYIVYKADSDTKTYTEYATLGSKDNTYMDYSVELGKTYYYYVRSFSDTVISPKSDEKSVTFPSSVPEVSPETPPTTQTFLIVLAGASFVVFIFYLIAKVIQKMKESKSKRLKNVLKDPAHYMK